MNKTSRIIALIVLVLWFLVLSFQRTTAQNVRLEGNTFVQQSNGDSISTGYYYQDRNGVKYPIFLSNKRKAYCWLKSKKTGKMYKRYLPKVTEELKKVKNA